MKNIYFVQANDVYGTDKKSVYIPYAAGCIQAFCLTSEIVRANYRFGKFIYTKEAPEAVVARLEEPYMVLFSCSVWNMEYNKALAAQIKKAYPDCLITFGGHNVSAKGEDLEKYCFVDFITHRFGEEPTMELLEALAFPSSLSTQMTVKVTHRLRNIPNISHQPIQWMKKTG